MLLNGTVLPFQTDYHPYAYAHEKAYKKLPGTQGKLFGVDQQLVHHRQAVF